MRQKGKENSSHNKLTRAIVLDLAFIVLGLSGLAAGTMAWFLNSVSYEADVSSFSIVSLPGIEYDLYYLDHFLVSEQSKFGNWNTSIEEYSGYAKEYASTAVFNQVEYGEDGNVDPTHSHAKDPTDIQDLWPAHKLTYAIALKGQAPSKFSLNSWAESVSILNPAQARRGVTAISIEKTGEEAGVRTFSVAFSDLSVTEFTCDGSNNIEITSGKEHEIDIENGKWKIDGNNTGILSSGNGGEIEATVLSIVKTNSVTVDAVTTDTYTITFSDWSTCVFTYDGNKIEVAANHAPTVEIEAGGKWIIDGVKTGISIDSESGHASSAALSIERTSSDTTKTFTITFGDDSELVFTYDGTDIVITSGEECEIEISGSDTWVIDGEDAEIFISADSGECADPALSIEKTSSVTLNAYEITFSDGSTSSFTYDGTDIVVPVTRNHTVTIESDEWVVDANKTDIAIDDEDSLPVDNVNLSWAIDIYGGAYSVANTGDDQDDIAAAFNYYYADDKEDVFNYSQENPAPEPESRESISILESASIPTSGSGYRTIIFFTIAFSNDADTFYLFDESTNLFRKNVNGNSKCYEGLSLTELSFGLS